MQTPKTRPGLLEVPQKKSPASTPKTARKLKTVLGTEPDLTSSPNPKIRTPKTQSPKVVTDRRSPKTPVNEIQKKRLARTPELTSQISQLQEELKKAKEQLSASEALKKQAEEEADERKQQLLEINGLEDSRIDELRKVSQERDKAWQSEVEAMQRQHAMDSAALASTMNEVQKLKAQLSESETKQDDQELVENLKTELNEMLSLVEKLRGELYDAKEAETRGHEIVSGTEKQLEIANLTLEMLRSDGMKMSETCNSLSMELEQSKFEVSSLEKLVRQLEEEREEARGNNNSTSMEQVLEENEQLKEEIKSARNEINQLKSAVEVTERRYHEEYIQSTLQIRSAYEQIEAVKSESSQKETVLKEDLKRIKAEMEGLHERLMDKDAKLRILVEENGLLNLKIKETEELSFDNSEIKKLEAEVMEMKARLMDKEMELQNVMSQNENLRIEMDEMQTEKTKVREEAEKSGKRAEHAREELGAAQVTNTELESELRRLKVQCDQWRKAAEAAAAMVSAGNGKYVERTGSLESPLRRNLNVSPYLDETDDEMSSPKKKNGSMLKKIGVLLKKTQK